jgi:arginase family enzyme
VVLAGSASTTVPVADIPARVPQVLAKAPLDGTVGYLHLDLDVLDPGVGQANAFPVAGGLSVPQIAAAIGAIRARVPLGAAAITSYAPMYDTKHCACRAAFAAIDAVLAGVA